MLWLVRFAFSKEEEEDEEQQHGQSVKIVFTCISHLLRYFRPIFLHAVTFSHVLHLDVLRRQIELKLKAKIEISLCMAIMQKHPLPSLYTQYYRTV